MPAYAKCVRMLGGLNDKEINNTYVKVDSSIYYFAFFVAFLYLGLLAVCLFIFGVF